MTQGVEADRATGAGASAAAGSEPGRGDPVPGTGTRRPLGIWIICGLLVANAVGIALLIARDQVGRIAHFLTAGAFDPSLWPVLWLYMVACLVAAVMLWRRDRRGWALTMVLVGVGLLTSLAQWWNGDPNHLRMGLNALMAFYLNSQAVRRLFERREDVSKIVLSSREPAWREPT